MKETGGLPAGLGLDAKWARPRVARDADPGKQNRRHGLRQIRDARKILEQLAQVQGESVHFHAIKPVYRCFLLRAGYTPPVSSKTKSGTSSVVDVSSDFFLGLKPIRPVITERTASRLP